ncbi:MAG: hypothetical protein A3A96_03030 [Candidatus Zambryskibacteria bacterium RIFCSPLOWO2_01_FULL_39_39]|uniref:DNA-directed DNA polymerase n=1 Tax=Candidatus Zambryskibacteria bacterium RIFCSPLOWO2_01_FULL_39_39 TaxID=1802758 RepID=A0A1G2TWD5_9BACT|nr:MAG: polymerase protein [Parcubacteria group bacterium GW2011_GWA1_38_7]OHA94431.1 MAG: hypothetical protein A3B88_01895 [Candidatus Zambryskibacteria bacterium RIFCSPHIGHO2_02_FULL_39_19]OHA98757.1 MAG: hypothetical protein A3F20_00715 [Candidatus Zambryskibacteria bacterium RIFCSPHIGHO2_12_FULL_39_21]OHB01616.1 MAG: hypothetical protein A3A96_03030 [Candidatus Zambryskibacteria bacterium RIFCSPLOWO2_01_FULL_39_39]
MAKPEKTKERLVLLDAHAILHRAYHALPDFATSSGQPTGALYGLATMILKIATDLKPDYIIACYDLPKPTYRHEVYENYKAGRAKSDPELVSQMEKSKEVCTALGIPTYSHPGFEADDILGTIVEELKEKLKKDLEIIIASGDMDTMQLVDDNRVMVYTLKKGLNDTILYDEKAVLERFSFLPKLLPSFKGLRGDPSDNIIGIEGIGEKSATELIVNFGSIEEIYKTLKKNKDVFIKKGIKKRIVELLKEGEEEARFSEMLATIRRDAPIDFEMPKKSWKEGINLENAQKLFGELQFRTMSGKLQEVLKKNGREIVEEKQEENIDERELEEVSLALWVADSNITDPKLEDILNFANTRNFKEAKKVIFEELKRRESEDVFEKIEKPLIPVVNKMQKHGVLVDIELIKKLADKYKKELSKIEKNIWKQAGVEFNISSPKQLGEILFDKMGLFVKNLKKTSGGARSTRESELEKLKDTHLIIPLILEYRELSKLLSTYLEPIQNLVDKDNKLHARFVLAGSTTGRMASQNPNLQNIPIGTDRGRLIRDAFVSDKGKSLVAFDYSQVELRIAAFLSKDEKLIEIFKSGKDVHSAVAAEVYGVEEKEVSKEMRRGAKVINFGILYGMGVSALQGNLGTDRKTAQEFYNKYFETFSGLSNYLDQTKIDANRLGYTKTFFGRRRYFEGIKSKIPFIRAAAERMAVNAPIQGTSADLTKIAMRDVNNYLEEEKLGEKINLILQIHDEIVYEIDSDILEKVVPQIKLIMESALTKEETLGVPIVVNSSVGENWGNLK